VAGAAGRASAQTVPEAPSVALDRFSPGEAGSGWFALDVLELRGHMRWVASAVTDEAYRPLISKSTTGDPDQSVVSDQLVTHLQGALLLKDRFRIAVSLPVVLVESGDAVVVGGVAYPTPGSGIGDPRIGGDVRLFGDEHGPLVGAAGLQVDIPLFLGARSYSREDTLRLSPHFAVAGRRGIWAYAGRVGLLAHVPRDFSSDLPLGTNLQIAGAAGAHLWHERLLVGPEVYGSTMLDGDGPFKARSTPLEALLGAHYAHESGLGAGLGVGFGLTNATGTPPFRLLLNVSYSPRGSAS
jgi:hypothetical protein